MIIAWIMLGLLAGLIGSLMTGAVLGTRARVITVALTVGGAVLGGLIGQALDTSEAQLLHMLGAGLGALGALLLARLRMT